MPPAVVVRRKAFVKNGRGAGQSSAGACCESQNQANLGFAGQQRGRDVGVGQLPAVDSQAGKAAFAVVGILHPDVQPAAAEILVHCKARPFAGDGRCQAQPIQVRAQPRMPSTQPTMTVEAVPVSQCTWERPKCLLAGPSVNWP